jgi:hypothetical protein
MPTHFQTDQGDTAGSAVQKLAAESLKKTIAYFYLLSFCPPDRILEYQHSLAPLRKALAESVQMSEKEYFIKAIPEVCRRIVAFHEDSREPNQELISELVNAAGEAELSPHQASIFQQNMLKIAGLPPRARPEGRLHRKKGCQFCQAPCTYGYFTLVSDPPFILMDELFIAETRKPISEQTPLNPAFHFTLDHLERLTGTRIRFIDIRHLVNLSYCLLMLGTAKSRMAMPEQQLRIFQAASQEFIQRYQRRGQTKPV